MATHQRPLHALLGGGAVADLLLWRRRNVSAAAVAGATLVWFLFERAGYSLPSVLSNAVLLLVVILFFWAKSTSLLNRVQALILSPTRELATQTERVMQAVGQFMSVDVHACVGGRSIGEDIRKLEARVQVVSGTPGRVCDMIKRRTLAQGPSRSLFWMKPMRC